MWFDAYQLEMRIRDMFACNKFRRETEVVRTITFEQLCKWKISNYICSGSGILHHAIETLLPMCSTFHAGHDPNARYGQQYPNIVQMRNLKLCIRSGILHHTVKTLLTMYITLYASHDPRG